MTKHGAEKLAIAAEWGLSFLSVRMTHMCRESVRRADTD
jgi:hypothetical protein